MFLGLTVLVLGVVLLLFLGELFGFEYVLLGLEVLALIVLLPEFLLKSILLLFLKPLLLL